MGGVFSRRASSALVKEEEGGDSAVIAIHSAAEWNKMLQTHSEAKLMVVDFSASWCGPCRFIEPAFKTMSTKFNNAVFFKIDVDELPAVAKQWKVEAMPTFVLMKRGQEVDRVVGADKAQLERAIQMHLAS